MKTIGYLTQLFPSLSMTFVYREVNALRESGITVETFSTWKPKLSELSEEAKSFVDETYYIFPVQAHQFIWHHLRYILSRPIRYFSTLFYLLSREHRTIKNRLRTLLHFGEAMHLAREIERRKIEHLHVHFALNAATVALAASRLLGITFSFTAHANDIFANSILLPEKIRDAQFIVAISEYNVRFLHNIVSDKAVLEKTHLVHCGIDVERFSPVDRQVDNDQFVILGVARLVEKKGFPYLIEACKILVDRGYDFRCFIGGPGPQETLLREMVETYDLSDKVILTGVIFQEKLREYLNKSDLFVLPCIEAQDQDMDGIPNSLMEAMAMEIPTISTDISGIPELIEDGKTGLLVPPNDAQALAEAMITLIENEKLRKRLGVAGRIKVVQEFEIKKTAHDMVNLFVEYLGQETAEPTPNLKAG